MADANKIQNLFQFELIFPITFLIIGFSLAPYEHSFINSYEYLLKFPLNGLFSLLIFSYFVPRVAFITYRKEPNLFQQKILYCLTFLFFILGFLILK